MIKYVKPNGVYSEVSPKNIYFPIPVQIKFSLVGYDDEDDVEVLGGFGIDNKIICGCCGAEIDLDDVLEIQEYQYWANVSDDIMGD